MSLLTAEENANSCGNGKTLCVKTKVGEGMAGAGMGGTLLWISLIQKNRYRLHSSNTATRTPISAALVERWLAKHT